MTPTQSTASDAAVDTKIQSGLAESYARTGVCRKALTAYSRIEPDPAFWAPVAECLFDTIQPIWPCDVQIPPDWNAAGYETWEDIIPVVDTWLAKPPDGMEVTAKTYRDAIKRRMDSVDCRYHPDRALCYSKIKLEYDTVVFTGEDFLLEDAACHEFKDDYDRLYLRSYDQPR